MAHRASIQRFVVLLFLALLAPAQQVSDEDAKAVDRLAGMATNAERLRAVDIEHIALTPGLLRGLCNRGREIVDAHDFAKAEAIYNLALGLAEQRQELRLQAIALGGLSNVQRQTNEYQKAFTNQQRGLAISRQMNDRWMISSGLLSLSSIATRLGDEEGALAATKEGLALALELHDDNLESNARNSLAIAHKQRGEYRASLEQFLKALELDRRTGDRGSEAIALGNIGGVYSDQGDLDLAIEYYKQSLTLSEQVNYRITQARFTGNLASVYAAAGKLRIAGQTAQRALELAEALKHREIIASSLGILSDVAWSEGRRKESVATLEKAVAVLEEIGNKDILGGVLPALGSRLVELGQAPRGLSVLERARGMAHDTQDRNALYQACTEEGKALRRMGRTAEARERLEEAIGTVEGLRREVDGGAGAQQRYFADKFDPYHEMALISAARGGVAEAFEFAERGRMQALLEVLRGGHVSTTKAMTAAERERESGLRRQTAALNQQLAQARAKGGSGVRELEGRLNQARVELESMERALYAAHPELRSQRLDVKPASVSEASALLPDGRSALLEYVVTEEATLLFVVTRNAPAAVLRIPISAKALQAKIEVFANRIATRDLDYRAAAAELEKLLVAPARGLLAGRSLLIVVPDGALWRLPFAALESAAGESLLTRYTMFYAPSATVLREVTARRQGGGMRSILAVGNPPGAGLAGMEKGLGELTQLYGAGNSLLLTGASASESAFKQAAPGFDVVQIATHGVLDHENPLYSYVSLAGDAANDGFLEARELAELSLTAQLVVLSACESARGKFGGGEGLVGLTWALFLAGSPATIASSWKVDGETTSKLMVELHRGLRRSESRAGALRSAALAVKADARYRHPFYWAAFSLSGSGF